MNAAEIKVHPVAAAFPMLSDDELADLAEDIRENGLVHPIVVDPDNVLIDGRNRHAACKIADVEPTFERLPDGIDPVAYIIAANMNRRHMTPGQRAMVGAMIRRSEQETKLRLSGRHLRIAKLVGVSPNTLMKANAVLRYRQDLSEQVSRGGSLEEAYQFALERKAAEEDDERRLRRLRRMYPDLAARVDSGELSLAAAIATADMLDRAAAVDAEIAAAQQQITLRLDELDRTIPLSLPEAAGVAGAAVAGPDRSEAGEFMQEIAAEIDEVEIERRERFRDRLRVRERLLAVIHNREPAELSEGLTIDQSADLVMTLNVLLRWVVAARAAALAVSTSGRLEVLR